MPDPPLSKPPKVDEPSPTFPRVGSRGDVGAGWVRPLRQVPGFPAGRLGSHVTDGSGVADELGLMIRLLPNHVVVGVIGDVDMATAPDLGCLLGALVDRGHTDVVLDFAKLDFLGSCGLQMIGDAAARLRPSGGVLRIRSPSARIRWLLDVSEVSGLVEFEPSDPDLVPLGSVQQAGDGSTIVSAAAAEATVQGGWGAAMADGHDVVDAALELVTSLAQAAVGGADGASVSLARHGRMGTVAATDDTVAQMDRDRSSRQAHIPLRCQATEIMASAQPQVPLNGSGS